MATRAPLSDTEAVDGLLLKELKDAHRELLTAMSDLDNITRGPCPSKEAVVTARWNLSRSSLARRTLWSRIRTHLACGRLSECDEAVLAELQQNEAALIRASTQHISAWKIDSIMADWRGYGRSSVELRRRMLAGIGLEKRKLYPILQFRSLRGAPTRWLRADERSPNQQNAPWSSPQPVNRR